MPWRWSGMWASTRRSVGTGPDRAHTAASSEKCWPTVIGAGVVRKTTTIRSDSRRALPGPATAAPQSSASAGPARGQRTRPSARQARVRLRRPATVRPRPLARTGEGAAEDRFAILVADALGDVGRQLGEPGAGPDGVLGNVVPALRHERIGAEHEAVGKFQERLAPLGGQLAALSVIGAEREIGPEGLVLAQHLSHSRRLFEAGMGPQDPGARVEGEEPLDGVGVGVSVE